MLRSSPSLSLVFASTHAICWSEIFLRGAPGVSLAETRGYLLDQSGSDPYSRCFSAEPPAGGGRLPVFSAEKFPSEKPSLYFTDNSFLENFLPARSGRSPILNLQPSPRKPVPFSQQRFLIRSVLLGGLRQTTGPLFGASGGVRQEVPK